MTAADPVPVPGGADIPLGRFLAYFLKLGTVGFGGPIALVARMQRELVDERRWIAREAFLEGLALAQLAPGPLAAQLAIYLGWLRAGVIGATAVGIAFVLPSFVIVLALAALYVGYQGLPWIQAAFYGIGAAVLAIIARGAVRLSRTTLGRDAVLWGLAILNAATTLATGREIVWLFFASGLLAAAWRFAASGYAARTAALLPPWIPLLAAGNPATLPGLAAFVPVAGAPTVPAIGAFFSAAGMFVFGSGLAIVPFLRGGLVDQLHWLSEGQFVDAVAVAMITPGPVVITVAFIGYLLQGTAGAAVAAAGVFVPCWLVVLLLAPFYRRVAAHPFPRAFVAGVTAASCGALAGAVGILGRRMVSDLPAVAIAAAAWLLLARTKRVPEPWVLAGAAGAGLLLRLR